MRTLTALTLLALLCPVAAVTAQISGHGDSGEDCSQEAILGLIGVTSTGNIEACFYYPREVLSATDQFDVSAILTAPASTGAGTATMVSTFTLSGCTAGAQTNGGPGGTGFGTQFRTRLHITMTSQGCSIVLNMLYKNGAGTTLYDADFTAKIIARDSYQRSETHLCNSNLPSCSIANVAICNASDASATNSCKDPDSRVFLCAASTADPLIPSSCTTPTQNVAQSGAWQIDNQQRLCAASNFAAACTTPNLNVSQHEDIATACFPAHGIQLCLDYPHEVDANCDYTQCDFTFDVAATLDYSRWPNPTAFTPSIDTPSWDAGSCPASFVSDVFFPDGTHTPYSDYASHIFRFRTGYQVGAGSTCNGTIQVRLVRNSDSATTYGVVLPISVRLLNPTIKEQQCEGQTDNTFGPLWGCIPQSPGTGNTSNNISHVTVTQCSTAALQADSNACRLDLSGLNYTRVPLSFPGNAADPGVNWWLELLFWVAVFGFCWRFKSMWVLAFAIGGSIHLFSPTWYFDLAHSLPLLGLGALLEILTAKRRTAKEKRREDGNVT